MENKKKPPYFFNKDKINYDERNHFQPEKKNSTDVHDCNSSHRYYLSSFLQKRYARLRSLPGIETKQRNPLIQQKQTSCAGKFSEEQISFRLKIIPEHFRNFINAESLLPGLSVFLIAFQPAPPGSGFNRIVFAGFFQPTAH